MLSSKIFKQSIAFLLVLCFLAGVIPQPGLASSSEQIMNEATPMQSIISVQDMFRK
jgi:hypothetical protein